MRQPQPSSSVPSQLSSLPLQSSDAGSRSPAPDPQSLPTPLASSAHVCVPSRQRPVARAAVGPSQHARTAPGGQRQSSSTVPSQSSSMPLQRSELGSTTPLHAP